MITDRKLFRPSAGRCAGMEVKMVCVGYAGCEAFDVILYIGRVLTKLKLRVLIVDFSETRALTKAIKHGMNLDSRKEIINYRDINYTRKIPSKEELELFKYGVVLVYYGMNDMNKFPVLCKKMNIVVNTLSNIIEDVNTLLKNSICYAESFNLLIRDIVTIDDVEKVRRKMEPSANFQKMFHLYYEVSDYECAVICQQTQIARFTKITKSMEKSIIMQLHDIIPQINERKIKKAVTAAKKGV